MPPKYSLLEIERRWSVDSTLLPPLEGMPFLEIEDRYLAGTRMRLRRVTGSQGPSVYKLCKKYGPTAPWVEPITNLYLTEREYEVLRDLHAKVVRKRRYRVEGGSLDIFEDGRAPVFEIEFDSEGEARMYSPPGFAVTERLEVTGTGEEVTASREVWEK